jgi:hypothetical protein
LKTLSASPVKPVLFALQGKAQSCVQGNGEDASGRIDVKFIIDKDGRIANASVTHATVASSTQACFLRILKGTAFPKAESSGILIVSTFFTFGQAAKDLNGALE